MFLSGGKGLYVYNACPIHAFVQQRQDQRLKCVHLNRCFLKVGKKLQKGFWKSSVINKFAKN